MKPLSKNERNGAIAIALVALAVSFGGFALKRCGTVKTADVPESALIFAADTLNAAAESEAESETEYPEYKKSKKRKHRRNRNDSTSRKHGKKGKSKSGKRKSNRKNGEDNYHRRNHLSEPITTE